MQRFGIVVCVLAGALASACGGSSGPSTSPTPTGGGSGGSSNVVTITIKGVNGKLSFDPNPATVQAGQVVVFKNADVVTHHVMLDDKSMETTDIAAGASNKQLPIGAINTA
jgi:plastocyanin